jgi:dTDP-glucose 4,6-dehydratase
VCADYLVHGASVTASKMMVDNPVETIMTAIEGTKNMMDFATRCKMHGVVYLSSMEAYGIVKVDHGEVYEKDLGFIDSLNVRSSYSEGKRMTECLCASFASEYGVNVKIARLAQTFGAGIDKNENRVFAQFAKSVMNNENIVLHTNGEKANCYCYTSDAVAGLIILLLKGEAGQAYNVANMKTFCSIKEMAKIFVRVGKESSSELVFDIPEDISGFGYAPSSIMKLNSEKIMSLGWKPLFGMEDMAIRLMNSMNYNENEKV